MGSLYWAACIGGSNLDNVVKSITKCTQFFLNKKSTIRNCAWDFRKLRNSQSAWIFRKIKKLAILTCICGFLQYFLTNSWIKGAQGSNVVHLPTALTIGF